MESLAKKYDERFKAAGEVNSRLLAEEAAFRDIQVSSLVVGESNKF
jgi:epidermal growth factor receptor substrate 15